MFLNQTNFSGVSAPFTKQIFLLLTEMEDLAIYAGDNKKADAFLIGVIKSPKNYRKTFKTKDFNTAKNIAPDAIGGRPNFFASQTNRMKVFLHLVLIKNPLKEEIDLIKSEWGDKIKNQKIVFNEVIPLESSVTLELFGEEQDADSMAVSMTQKQGAIRQRVIELAQIASKNFKELILNVF